MSRKLVRRIITAAALTITLALPVPAGAATAHRAAAAPHAWQWLTDLWTRALRGILPAGSKQGPMIDPNGLPIDSGTITSSPGGDQGPMIDPNG